MKKLFILAVCVALMSMLLASCGGDVNTPSSTDSSVEDAPSTKDSGNQTVDSSDSASSTANSDTEDGTGDNLENDKSRVVIDGIVYRLSDYAEEYYVEGVEGDDIADLVIADECEGMPVTKILYKAFDGIEGLKSLHISKNITGMENGAIGNCQSLTSITVSEENTKFLSIDGNLYQSEGRMLYVYAIGKTDESFTVPDKVSQIWSYAFENCTNIKNVNLNKVRLIGGGAFKGCTNLRDLVLPDSVQSIDGWAFFGCSSIESVEIPKYTVEIGEAAFADCQSLKEIRVSEDNNFFESENGILYATLTEGEGTVLLQYPAGKEDTHLYINASRKLIEVDKIAALAFRGAKNLVSIVIDEDSYMKTIGNGAFWDCVNLEAIVLNSSVTNVGNNLFTGCEKLTIYCQHSESEIEGFIMFNRCWFEDWNYLNRPVVYDYVYEN